MTQPPMLKRNTQDVEARKRSRYLLIAATLGVFFFSMLPFSQYVLYPLRLFVTFVHESGHAMAGTITGGIVQGINISPNGSGVTLIRASLPAQWIIDPAGYLWAALFGALLLQAGRFRGVGMGKVVLTFMSIYVLAVTIIWCHNPFISGYFTPLAGVSISAILFLLAKFGSKGVTEFLAMFLAVQCSLNALNDLATLVVITNQHMGDNDAVNMAHATGIPAIAWAIIWVAMALTMLFISFRSYWKATSVKQTASAQVG